ncbi:MULTISPECIES: hypothetical protein [Bacillota]|jgi:hypothetical protein|uniref:Uncharacterized protein n=2 Tax=Amedibacillus TaxID=2749846 RepID=A0A7G9GQY6_9FIRM|nr:MULTISPECIES: hypothetical protein [Bacillota]QNM13218.1 hypothetical protein H9Q80_04495 [[Eubacterium] hominis]MCH4285420.1 hypothetical protein [Amedibacillus hominis]RGB52074.1 hypothetical protein DW271_14045 [Absiella sp. AM22-9]RGB59002.1 hypothetical protein DW120_13165 [Absiella sp. AM10-20]RGB65318.1 hypothetical protein DW113_12125 [Absiella sp. AM09-45]
MKQIMAIMKETCEKSMIPTIIISMILMITNLIYSYFSKYYNLMNSLYFKKFMILACICLIYIQYRRMKRSYAYGSWNRIFLLPKQRSTIVKSECLFMLASFGLLMIGELISWIIIYQIYPLNIANHREIFYLSSALDNQLLYYVFSSDFIQLCTIIGYWLFLSLQSTTVCIAFMKKEYVLPALIILIFVVMWFFIDQSYVWFIILLAFGISLYLLNKLLGGKGWWKR